MATGWVCLVAVAVVFSFLSGLESTSGSATSTKLRFNADGQFKIVQVADMHYGNGASTECQDVFPYQMATCSDLNTTAFLERMIATEKPDLLVFTGDNIFQADSTNVTASLMMAFGPAMEAQIPWAAILGNHDQEPALSGPSFTRSEVMDYIVQMPFSVSAVSPEFRLGNEETIDGFGNFYLQVYGAKGSSFETTSVLNLYFVDSGDYAGPKFTEVSYYDWIKASQQVWIQQVSAGLQANFLTASKASRTSATRAPALGFHHIPIPEALAFEETQILGTKMEFSGHPRINSGFLTSLVTMGDVEAVFTGHDHLNDYCGEVAGTYLCFGGGFGYHAYGKAGWPRRSRVIEISLKGEEGSWEDVMTIQTFKRLDDEMGTVIDKQTLYSNFLERH